MTETSTTPLDYATLPFADDAGRTLAGILARAPNTDPARLLDAMTEAAQCGAPIERAVLTQAAASEDNLIEALARQHQIMHISRAANPADPSLSNLLPLEFCLKHTIFPWMRIGRTIVIAGAYPDRFEALIRLLEPRLGRVIFALAPEADIHAEITNLHSQTLVRLAEVQVPLDQSCRDINSLSAKRTALATVLCLSALALLAKLPLVFFALVLSLALGSLALAQLLKAATTLASLWPEKAAPARASWTGQGRDTALPLVSVLVPLFREENIANALVTRLKTLRYPKSRLDVVLVLEEDDHKTREMLSEVDLPAWMRVISVPEGSIKTKPRAMNYALNFCRGDLIGIYDAEDAPAADQIDKVAAFFKTAPPDVACVQGILDFYNPRANWISRCFAIEYATWFRVILPGLQRLRLAIPLGGTTLFIRRDVLEMLHGWDAHNVTEDADLGIRLARKGYRTVLLPTVTREEANNRFWPWIKQRSRWLKGYIMTYLVHMRRPALLLRELGPWRFLGFQVMFLTAILQFTLAPILWSFWIVLLGVPHPVSEHLGPGAVLAVIALFLTSEAISLAASFLAIARSPHNRLFLWVPTMLLYFPLGVVAVYKALFEAVVAPFYWDKTSHGHSTPEPSTPESQS